MARYQGAGQLRERVRIDRQGDETTDEYGNPQPGGWETLIEAQPARIQPKQGNEEVQAQRLTGVITWEITLRGSAANRTIRASDRAVNEHTGEVFNIRHAPISPDERGHWLLMQVQTGVAT